MHILLETFPTIRYIRWYATSLPVMVRLYTWRYDCVEVCFKDGG
jgi:hypothetical protein